MCIADLQGYGLRSSVVCRENSSRLLQILLARTNAPIAVSAWQILPVKRLRIWKGKDAKQFSQGGMNMMMALVYRYLRCALPYVFVNAGVGLEYTVKLIVG